MSRYLIEREFPDDPSIRQDEGGESLCRKFTPDRKYTSYIYDGPTPAAVYRAAARNKLPISRITEDRVLDPYLYR